MINLVPISVECHSGYKADEYPKCFYRDGVRFEITEILDRWYQGDANPEFPIADYYKVKTIDGEVFVLKHEVKTDKWYIHTGLLRT